MGFNTNEVYQSASNRLKAADLQKQEWAVTIKDVGLAEFKEDDGRTKRMLELFFNETEKTLPLNKTNSGTIEYVHGPDTDPWIGKQIILFPTMVDFGGRMVEAIRIRVPLSAAPVAPPTAPPPATPAASPPRSFEQAAAQDDLPPADGYEEPPF